MRPTQRALALRLAQQAIARSDEVGEERVGVRLTPMGRFMGMGDEPPEAKFGHIVRSLNHWNLAYLHLVEPASSLPHRPASLALHSRH